MNEERSCGLLGLGMEGVEGGKGENVEGWRCCAKLNRASRGASSHVTHTDEGLGSLAAELLASALA